MTMMSFARGMRALCAAIVFLLAVSGHAADEIVLQLWGLPEQDLYQGITQAIREYDDAHPEIRIERGSPGGQVNLDPQKLMTSFVAGTPPDLVWMDRFQLAGWAARGVFRPLDDLYERDEIDRVDFYPACLDECIYKGETYGLPWNTDSRALWVNMEFLRRHGFTEPPKDWDELLVMAKAMTTRTEKGVVATVGFAPLFGNSWLYLYGWLNGGEFATPDNRKITLTHPKIVEALEWMDQVYSVIGGAQAMADFMASSQIEGAAEPFISGKIAMRVDGNWALDYVAKYRPRMDFVVVPPPAPKGRESVSWSGGFCWSIPRGARYTEEAWQLAKYLNSKACWLRAGELQAIENEKKARAQNFEEAYFIPTLSCSKSVNQAQIDRWAPLLPETIRNGFLTHVQVLDHCRFRPVLPVGALLWDEHVRATDRVLQTDVRAIDALSDGEKRVQRELDKYYAEKKAPAYSFPRVFSVTFAVVLFAGAAAWLAAFRRWKWSPRVRAEATAGLLFASPWIFGFVALLLGPMVASVLIALSEYNVTQSARWVGFDNFVRMAGFTTNTDGRLVPSDPLFWRSLRNTLYATALGVPLGIIVSLGLALLVNKEVRGVRIYRTLFYLPVVVPTVCTAVLWMWLLNNQTGVTGALLAPIFTHFGKEPISFFGDARYAGLGIVLMVTWGAGSSMIIWLAGLKSIPSTYYEAASIDGAGTLSQFWRITLPMLSPYLFFNLVMGIIGWLQIFTQAYVLIVPPPYGPNDSLLFYVMYLFVRGFQYFDMGYACAMAWILFIIVALLTLVQFKLAPKWVHYER